jgi:hypothetical protein
VEQQPNRGPVSDAPDENDPCTPSVDKAYFQKQIDRLLGSAERLVARYDEQVDNLGPMAALEAFDRVLSLVERIEARRDGRAGTANAINVTVNGIDIGSLKFSPAADTNGSDGNTDS